MLIFSCGFFIGIYIGTYYDCKPVLESCSKYIMKYFPRKKN